MLLTPLDSLTDWFQSDEAQLAVAIHGTVSKLKDLFQVASGSGGPVSFIVMEVANGILTNIMKCENYGFFGTGNSAPRCPLAPSPPPSLVLTRIPPPAPA